MRVTASATSRSNAARVILSERPRRCDSNRSLAHRALRAQRLRPADAAPVQDLHVGGERPHLLRQRLAQLRLDLDRDRRPPQSRSGSTPAARADRPAARARRARARARRSPSCGPTPGSAVSCSMSAGTWPRCLSDELLRHADQRLRLLAEEPGREDQRFEVRRSRPPASARASGIALEERRRDQLTRSSVDCADRIVATSSSNGLR